MSPDESGNEGSRVKRSNHSAERGLPHPRFLASTAQNDSCQLLAETICAPSCLTPDGASAARAGRGGEVTNFGQGALAVANRLHRVGSEFRAGHPTWAGRSP